MDSSRLRDDDNPSMDGAMKSITEQIKSAERELAIRKKVYPGLISKEKMTADEVRHEIECMESIVETLRMFKQGNLL